MEQEKLVWSNAKRKVNELLPYEGNPRQMTEAQAELLKKSIETYNLVEVPAIDTDNRIVAGHQRLKIMQMLGRGNEEIDVRVPNRKLTEDEFVKYNLISNKVTGEWSYDLLANLDPAILTSVGWTELEVNNIFQLQPSDQDWVNGLARNLPPEIQDSHTISFTCSPANHALISAALKKSGGANVEEQFVIIAKAFNDS